MSKLDDLVIKPANSERLTDVVCGQLLDLISEGQLKPGDELPPAARLAERFGVSKTVIREALRELAAMGTVDIRQGKPPSIKPLSSTPLEKFFRIAISGSLEGFVKAIELRRILEVEIVALAAERIDDDGISQLENIMSKMKKVIASTDQWVEADLQFHYLIAKSSQNRLMMHLTRALRGIFEDLIYLIHERKDAYGVQGTIQRHEKILEALRDGDPIGAREAMIAHFDASEPVLLATIKELETEKSKESFIGVA